MKNAIMMRLSFGLCRYSTIQYQIPFFSFFLWALNARSLVLKNLHIFLSFFVAIDEISRWRSDYILSLHQMRPQVFRELNLYQIWDFRTCINVVYLSSGINEKYPSLKWPALSPSPDYSMICQLLAVYENMFIDHGFSYSLWSAWIKQVSQLKR